MPPPRASSAPMRRSVAVSNQSNHHSTPTFAPSNSFPDCFPLSGGAPFMKPTQAFRAQVQLTAQQRELQAKVNLARKTTIISQDT